MAHEDPPLPMAPSPATPPVDTLLGQKNEPPQRIAPQIIAGTGKFVRPLQVGQTVGAGEPVEINFVNADIRAVMDAVLGKMLGLNYTVDPKVQGQVTIRTTRPLPRSQALAAVDAALQEQGFAILAANGFYEVVPAAEATGQAPVQAAGAAERTAGFTTAIVPTRFVSAGDLEKVVRPLTRPGFIDYIDSSRNIFVVSGIEREIQSFTELVASFDVNWLAGLSFSLHTLQAVEPEELEAELKRVLQLDNGPMHGMIDLMPIPRLNGLLVASKRPELLETVANWIDRLDRPGPANGRLMHYYEVQNGSAAELVRTLNRLTGRADSAGAGERDRGARSMSSSLSRQSAAPLGVAGVASTSPRNPIDSVESAPPGELSGADEAVSELKGVRIVADERRNALLIFGTKTQYDLIEQALSRLDAPREQVLIEATIAEVTLTDDLSFGVQWYLSRGSNSVGFAQKSNKLGPSFPGFNYSFLTGNTQAVLTALASVTNVQVLSAPRLMVMNNETARLQVGDEVPIVTQQATSLLTTDTALVNSIQYQNTGVILEVTPKINHSGAVVLDVSQEVSTVANTTSSGIDSPTIQQRKISSVVNVQDGETVALGGLISDTVSRTGSGIPYLSQIPVLGYLFGANDHNKQRTELLVFMRPVIVRDVGRAREVTEALRTRMQHLEALSHSGAQGGTER